MYKLKDWISLRLIMKLHMVNSLDGLCQYNKLFYNFYIFKFYYNADIIFNCIYFYYTHVFVTFWMLYWTIVHILNLGTCNGFFDM
jgi:hypothetical protein